MPTPTTTDLPRPKSWDEFEDICADVLKKLWNDPYLKRNGRSGQAQAGVDIYGRPTRLSHLGKSAYAGAQCKRQSHLSIQDVRSEVTKAQQFRPSLIEYLVMTTAPRDAELQEAVRLETWPMETVDVMAWEDICLELSGHDDLLKKHFSGWMKATISEANVLDMLFAAQPEDFQYESATGIHYLKSDINLRIVYDRASDSMSLDDREMMMRFREGWVERFLDHRAYRQMVYMEYSNTRVKELNFVSVDGGRFMMPFPRSEEDLVITRIQYQVGRILNLWGSSGNRVGARVTEDRVSP